MAYTIQILVIKINKHAIEEQDYDTLKGLLVWFFHSSPKTVKRMALRLFPLHSVEYQLISMIM